MSALPIAANGIKYDYLIVGAGFAGSVLAERLASQHGAKILMIDRRPHIGGNAYDEPNEAGILYHKYGPHIFHTNSEQVWDYLSQFTQWRPYEHRVRAIVRDKLVPIPINRTTLNELFGLDLKTDEEAADYRGIQSAASLLFRQVSIWTRLSPAWRASSPFMVAIAGTTAEVIS